MYQEKFAKTHQLFNQKFSETISRIKVAVIGVGGVGSWAAEALVRMGVQHILLIDGDVVAIGNTNRQIHALLDNYGKSKVYAMRERLLQINPDAYIEVIDDFLTAAMLPPIILSKHLQEQSAYPNLNDYDFVLDCCDDFNLKFALLDWSLAQTHQAQFNHTQAAIKKYLPSLDENSQKLPLMLNRLIMAGAAGGKTDLQALALAPINQTEQDPLLAKLRYQIRKKYKNEMDAKRLDGYLNHIICAYSQQPIQKVKNNSSICEAPQKSSKTKDVANDLGLYLPKASLNCAGFGSSMLVTATMGFLMVQAVQEKLLHL